MIDQIISTFIADVSSSGASISVYTANPVNNYFSTAGANFDDNWQVWRKPPGTRMVWIQAQAGGSSGGCGANSGASGGGGGCGGCSGELKSGWFPAFMLPDTLYIQVGAGGVPTVASSAFPGIGGHTYVAMDPIPRVTVEANASVILMAGAGGNAAQQAANATVGMTTLGAIRFATPITSNPRQTQGISQANTAPSNGASDGGGPVGPGESISIVATFSGFGFAQCGGGGGGNEGTGGIVMASGVDGLSRGTLFQYTPEGSSAGSGGIGLAGSNGSAGFINKFMFWNYGGNGGGGGSATGNTSSGGGGDAILGAGGGGSGGTVTGATLGKPGNGGDGFVVIMAW